MSKAFFNREVKRLLTSNCHPVLTYVNDKFNKQRRYIYFDEFFDDFLYNYGILSLELGYLLKGNKYIAYVNCNSNNIFGEDAGVTYLSSEEQSLTESQITLAKFLIRKLKNLSVENFEN
jgi:hypothetical protein